MKISAIVCAYNEAEFLPACLHSLFTQTRPPDEIIVVNNASSDQTAAVAAAIAGVRVVDEPVKGLVVARETGRGAALRRVVEPTEVTRTVMFLCSDDASAITGQEIRVCAGAAMG